MPGNVTRQIDELLVQRQAAFRFFFVQGGQGAFQLVGRIGGVDHFLRVGIDLRHRQRHGKHLPATVDDRCAVHLRQRDIPAIMPLGSLLGMGEPVAQSAAAGAAWGG